MDRLKQIKPAIYEPHIYNAACWSRLNSKPARSSPALDMERGRWESGRRDERRQDHRPSSPRHHQHLLSSSLPQSQRYSSRTDSRRHSPYTVSTQQFDRHDLYSPSIQSPASPAGTSSARHSTGMTSGRRQRRPENLKYLRPTEDSAEPGLLYPQMSPYEPPTTAHSAPDELESSKATDAELAFLEADYLSPTQATFAPGSLPRSPTFPPDNISTNRTRARSATQGADAALQHEEDYHLFMEATAGLGPLPHFRRGSTIETTVSASDPHLAAPSPREFVVSPLSETPVRSYSVNHLMHTPHIGIVSPQTPISRDQASSYVSLAAQDPARSYLPQHTASLRRRPVARQATPPVDISDSGLDMWDGPRQSSATILPPSAEEQWLAGENTSLPPDDELPSYAMSQAQAHAAQRGEATRRARELQERWTAARLQNPRLR